MNTNEEHLVERPEQGPEPLLSMSATEMLDLSLASLPKSFTSFCALLPKSPGTLSPRCCGSFVSTGSKSELLNSTFSLCKDPSALSFDSTFSLSKDTSALSLDANTEHFARTKNRDNFFVGDVYTVWSPEFDSPVDSSPREQKKTLDGHLNQLFTKANQCSVPTNSTSRDVDPSKRTLSSPKPAGVPRLKRSKRPTRLWSNEEDRRLEEGVKMYGLRNWVLVAKHVATRNNKMCRQRWSMNVKPEINGRVKRGKWSAEEDEQLRQVLSRRDSKDARAWELASQAMGYTRNIKQIRGRWENFLDPNLRLVAWTEEEDACLLRLQREFGNKWTTFSSTLVGRSSDRIRNRFTQLRKQRSKDIYTRSSK